MNNLKEIRRILILLNKELNAKESFKEDEIPKDENMFDFISFADKLYARIQYNIKNSNMNILLEMINLLEENNIYPRK